MFATISFPENIAPEKLDGLLADGWYRMGQNIFTTHFLCFNNCFYSALWLRVDLPGLGDDTTFNKLKKQNRRFRIEIKNAEITPRHEELYKIYRQSVSFDPSETLQMLLYGYAQSNRFDTYMINMFEDNTLIAAGYFDFGNKSAAGIVSFYHPAYKKYSPGKYIIYSKIDFCRQQHIQYFYPGYVVPGYPPFDYKVSIGKESLQYYSLMGQQWLPYKSFTDEKDPLKLMRKKLEALQKKLRIENIKSALLYYRFFDANLDPYYSTDKLFDFPVFLYFEPLLDEKIFNLIVYDISNENYCLLGCTSVIRTDWYIPVEEIFSSHLLKVDHIFLTTPVTEVLIKAMVKKV